MQQTIASAKNNTILGNNNWQIVPAQTDDIPTIIHLACIIWPVAYAEILTAAQISYMLHLMYSHKALEQQMLHGEQQFHLVKQADKILGFAAIGQVSPELSYLKNTAATNPFKLHKLYVLPQYQGSGLGKALLLHCYQQALLQKTNYMVLNVNRGNNAFRFYQKNGFEVLVSDDFNIGQGFYMNDYIMGKKLG